MVPCALSLPSYRLLHPTFARHSEECAAVCSPLSGFPEPSNVVGSVDQVSVWHRLQTCVLQNVDMLAHP